MQLEVIHAQMVHDTSMTLRAFFSGDMGLEELERSPYGSFKLKWRKTFVASDATIKVLLSTGGMNLIDVPGCAPS